MARRWVVGVLAVAGAMLSAGAGAAVDCRNAMTQADMNQCAALDLERENARINASYNAYRRTLAPEAQAQLKEVQLAWIRFRDLACRFESGSSAGGSVNSMAMGRCLQAKTRQRALEIEVLGKCEEGDVTCRR